MPDCRAYEMVTPPYKDGFPVVFRSVRGGEFSGGAPLVTGASIGSFAGGFDQVEGSRGGDYAFVRGGAGWEAKPLDPSPAQYVLNPYATSREGSAMAVSPDGSALMMLHEPEESVFAGKFYVQTLPEALSGLPLPLVGPALPSGAVPSQPTGLAVEQNGVSFAGASEDLSNILYYIEPSTQHDPGGDSINLWPGDSTRAVDGSVEPQPRSLYEYVGAGHSEPALVGVNGSGELLGQCGVALGGPLIDEDELEDGGNVRGAVSADGSAVFFTVSPQCPNAEPKPGYGPQAYDLFARIEGQPAVSLSKLSESECEGQCAAEMTGDASFQGASLNGERAFFLSTQKLLPGAVEDEATHEELVEEVPQQVPDEAVRGGGCTAATGGGGCNLYEYDMAAPEGHKLTLVSAGSNTGAQVQGVAAVSDDGSHVYFVARAKLTGANGEGVQPLQGGENLYVFEDDAQTNNEGRLAFIATLSEKDRSQWRLDAEAPMDVTPDGRVLVFESGAPLTPEAEGGTRQVFEYNADETQAQLDAGLPPLSEISSGSEGVAAGIPHPHFRGAETIGASTHPAVSSNGEVVVFSSSAPLAAGASGSGPFVYEYREGRVSLISDPSSTAGLPLTPFAARLLGVSPSGADIFFETYGSLVPQDTDTNVDLYDAREAGGFSAPAQRSSCSACQTPEALAPAMGPLVTATQAPGQNQAPQPAKTVARPTRAQMLAKALHACRRKARKRRRACEAQARRRYGPSKAKAKKSDAGRR